MLHKKHIAIAAFLACSSLSGCGEEKDDDSDNSALISMADLQGTWLGACRKIGDVYGKTTYTFTDSTFTYQSAEYADEGCTEVDNSIFGRGTYELPGDMTTDDGVALAMINYTYVGIQWSFVASPSLAKDWSLICGDATITNHTLDVLDKTCANGSSKLNFGAKQFGTIWVNEDKIHLTDINSNGSTEESRSTKVDKTNGALTKLAVAEEAAAE